MTDACLPALTGMADSLLAEIAEALARLADTGERDAIDLRSLPLTDADRAFLHEALGTGEVAATLTASGESEVRETAFAGVWWVRHLGGGGEVAAEIIEITPLPEILASQPADIALAAARLRKQLIETEEAPHV